MPEQTTVWIEQWLVRLMEGDQTAPNEILRHSERRLRLLTRRMFHQYPSLRPWIQTDDVFIEVQDRMNRTLKNIPVKSARGYFSLATQQLRYALIDLWRKYVGPHGVRQPHPLGEMGTQEEVNGANIDSRIEQEDLLDWAEIHEWISQLPEEEKLAFELLWYQGLNHKEAANLLNISESMLCRNWQRARLHFQEKYSQFFID